MLLLYITGSVGNLNFFNLHLNFCLEFILERNLISAKPVAKHSELTHLSGWLVELLVGWLVGWLIWWLVV